MLVYQRVYDVIWNPCPRVAQELESDPGLDRKNEASPPWKQSTFASSAHHPSAPQDLTYKVGEAAM